MSEKVFKVLVIEDSNPERKELVSMLGEYPIIDVVGDTADIKTALPIIKNEQPDVVFLDIRLEKESGFDLLDRIKRNFQVVFVTGHPDYATRAFVVNALDFLVKPVYEERLDKTIKRMQEDPRMGNCSEESKNSEAVCNMGGGSANNNNMRAGNTDKSASKADQKVRVCSCDELEGCPTLSINDAVSEWQNDSLKLMKLSDIVYIKAEAAYNRVFTRHGLAILTAPRLQVYENAFPRDHFLRVHKSALINLNFIKDIKRIDKRNFSVEMNERETTLPISRKCFKKNKDLLALHAT
ncbi:MAG: response regulator transcription factor [bacterium]|nr:response regulator transcription factor [bacterium]